MESKKVWYAVLRDNDDVDYGTGSFDIKEATKKARQMRSAGCSDAHIAVVDPDDGYCFEVIRDI